MSEPWFDALDRLNITLSDAGTMFELVDRLFDILGRPPSAVQIDLAAGRFNQEFQQLQQAALLIDFGIDRFQRRGRTVFALRDRLGRFVTEGVQNIRDRLIP